MRHRQTLTAASLVPVVPRAENGSTASTKIHSKNKPKQSFIIPKATKVAFAALVVVIVLIFRSVSTRDDPHEMKGYVMRTRPRKFTPVPSRSRKTFWADRNKNSFPMIRALREHGWQKVNKREDAQIIYQYGAVKKRFTGLKPWQRFGHIPRYQRWNYKDRILDGFKEYQAKTGSDLYFLPESYRLTVEEDRAAFEQSLSNGGIHMPWVLKKPRVNQGKGIEMIPPNSQRLVEVTDKMEEEAPRFGYIIQRYVCNELTWNHRKFDVRMFWFVASINPTIVLYHDGYVRIGNSEYEEDNFDNTVSHLTTHTGLGEEGKATYEEFTNLLTEHHRSSPQIRHIRNPVQHVKNQFKDSLAQFIEAFHEKSFSHPGSKHLVPENGFGFFGADFIVDTDLDVWFIEPQKGCGLDEDYKMRVKMHDMMFSGIVDTLEEISSKQEAGEPVLPLKHTGKWEIIYGDRWRFRYEGYKRSKDKAGCDNMKRQKAK